MWLVILLFLSIAFIVLATARLKMHPFLALLLAAFGFGAASGMPLLDVVKAVNGGFGDTVGYIGIVILAGAIIGTFLERSGGAYQLAERTLAVTGERNVPAAMAIIGYIVSMPVFCDSAFVLLSSLNKALARRAAITLAASAIALSLGLYATHTMVPPTPGPVAAAGILEADLGLVILWGLVVSLFALAGGWLFAVKVAARTYISPEDDSGDHAAAFAAAQQAPSASKAILPIFVPIVLIVARSVSDLPARPFGQGGLIELLSFLGQPVVALLIGVALAMLLPVRFERDMLALSGWVGDSIRTAAPIIIITGSGGAFFPHRGGDQDGPGLIDCGHRHYGGITRAAARTAGSRHGDCQGPGGGSGRGRRDGGFTCQRQLFLGGVPVLEHERADGLPTADGGNPRGRRHSGRRPVGGEPDRPLTVDLPQELWTRMNEGLKALLLRPMFIGVGFFALTCLGHPHTMAASQ
jgi:GntP family gluconate:H+ symporter